ncbi:vacuolar protein sorting/targeting protein PEP1 [Recurvomyces mirabilis]|uniref:Vacuolar protein sorting/targeting protein PEP1 n=1 Tax=Recurvomyces mirabilis TaxID=574656 RepID=A0AAE0WSZ6_9PEZI|nr:vacuolar protein sorting/targeting protein PEP1 [Recurvomyces mirabilis]KAK5159286.1 vacuolar protein sorting/targeting protein PEP1 [Recurvomyces mirabilis]
MAISPQKYALVIGGSYVGIKAAQELAQNGNGRYHVVLVEANSHFQHLFAFPRFAVATGVETHKAFIPYNPGTFRDCPEGWGTIIQARAIDLTNNEVKLDRMVEFEGGQVDSLPYSYLVIATGTKLSPPSTLPGSDKLGGVDYLQKHVQKIRRSSKIAVIGAGAVGVQMATDVKELYPEKDVTLIHSRNHLMNTFDGKLHEIVKDRCDELGIKLALGSRVKLPPGGFPTDGRAFDIELVDGRKVGTELAIVCTGQTPRSEILSTLTPTTINESKFITLLPTLQIADPRHPNIFALGDVANTGAHKAARPGFNQALVVVKNILHLESKEALEDYDFSGMPAAIHLTLGIKKNVLFTDKRDGYPQAKHRDDGVLDMGIGAVWQRRGGGVDAML